MQYKIYKNIYPVVEKKLTRIGKKAIKYNNNFSFNIVEEGEDVKVDKLTKERYIYPYYMVDVEGVVKIADYECIAVLEMHETGNLIRRINKDIYIPDRFLNSEDVCECCGVRRNRKELYIVYNAETSDYKQVGSDCLTLYSGLNPQLVISYYDCLKQLEHCDITKGCVRQFNVKKVIGYASEIIAKVGYASADSDLPTKNIVCAFVGTKDFKETLRQTNKMFNLFTNTFVSRDFNKDETKELVNKIIEYYLSLEPTTEFIHNIQILLKEEWCEFKHIGLLSYLPEGYRRYLKAEAKKQAECAGFKDEYFGVIGTRYKNQNVSNIEVLTHWDTDYGTTFLYRILLDNNNILIWKSSNHEIEKVVKIDFTVKEHSVFNGAKQTVVTRCKLYC